ncbi:MAG TPA: diguanylate cyclase [Symbiobacteriaceae bacterium]|nr:diguanylate cyclase [Symbiobacteriaceae bacterium]
MTLKLDGLTGLPTGLEDELKRQVVREEGVSLALVDVDRFTEINEGGGRDAGDRVLQVLAAMLGDAFPNQAYRVGGDEFGVVMPGVALEQAFLRLEAFRAAVQAAADRFELPNGPAVTVTAGVVHCPRDAKDATGLLRKADSAIMAAKEGGRNQVALPLNEEMVMKSCYYPASSIRRLKALAEKRNRKESVLLREALDDLLRKYDQP